LNIATRLVSVMAKFPGTGFNNLMNVIWQHCPFSLSKDI